MTSQRLWWKRGTLALGFMAALFVADGTLGTAWGQDISFAKDVPKVKSSNPLSGDNRAVREGKVLYAGICAECHGKKADGAGTKSEATDLRVYSNGYSKFIQVVQTGTGAPTMPGWSEVLDENEIQKIGAFLETVAMKGAHWE